MNLYKCLVGGGWMVGGWWVEKAEGWGAELAGLGVGEAASDTRTLDPHLIFWMPDVRIGYLHAMTRGFGIKFFGLLICT